MSKYKAILYDIDGTVLDTAKMNMIPLLKIIEEELGEIWTYEQVVQYAGMQGMMVMEKLGIKDKEATYARWVKYVNEYPDGATLFEGIDTVIKNLAPKYRQGIVSSKFREQYEVDFIKSGLDDYMEVVILADDTIEHKPHPEPILKALDKLQLKKDEVLYLGDTIGDYVCCNNAGVDFGLVKWGNFDMTGIDNPTYIFETVEDIETTLK